MKLRSHLPTQTDCYMRILTCFCFYILKNEEEFVIGEPIT